MSFRNAALLVLFACALVFGRTLMGSYLSWDDIQHFQFNTWLRAGDVSHFWREPYYGLYIPVTYTLWTMLYKISSSPMMFHALNIGLHMANAILVLFIARELTASLRWALIVALIFALHPLQVEAVAWISGGRDLLSAFFGLTALALILRRRPMLATLAFAFGLLAKPALAPLPVAFYILARQRFDRRVAVLWSILGTGVLWITTQIQSPFTEIRVEPLALWQRPLVALDALGFYLRQFFAPWPLSADYGRMPGEVVLHGWYMGSLAILIAAALGITFLRRRWRIHFELRPLLFSLILLVPVLGLVPFEAQVQSTVFDRYMYLPMLGLALTLVLVWRELKKPAWPLPVILVTWALLSFLRTDVWSTNRKLFTDILEHNPRNYFAQSNFAIEEIADHNLDSAERHLLIARDLNSRLALARANLFHVYWLKRDPAAILQEAKPLLNDPGFLQYNRHEPQALALLFRMVARSHATIQHRREARWAYSQARALNPDDDELRTEVELFEQESR